MTVFSNLICYRYRWGREYIQPRASKRYLKSRAILDDRAFQAQITGDQPIVTLPWYSFILPSLVWTSTTDESRPPYLAGKPALKKSRLRIASGLKAENSPPT